MKDGWKPSVFWLFVFIPASIVMGHLDGIPAPLLFFSAALAIVPIAALSSDPGLDRAF